MTDCLDCKGRMCAASLSFVVRSMLDGSRFVKAHGECAPNHLDRFVPSFVVRQVTVSVKHPKQRPVRDEVPEMLTARERALVSQIFCSWSIDDACPQERTER